MKIFVSFQCSPETVPHGWDTKQPSRQKGFTNSHQPGLTGRARAVQGQRDRQRPGGSGDVRCQLRLGAVGSAPHSRLLVFSALGPRM